jgi:hypothetical protein
VNQVATRGIPVTSDVRRAGALAVFAAYAAFAPVTGAVVDNARGD